MHNVLLTVTLVATPLLIYLGNLLDLVRECQLIAKTQAVLWSCIITVQPDFLL
jgi:hypothetical protein